MKPANAALSLAIALACPALANTAHAVELLPRAGATGVNPDTPLRVVFDAPPVPGSRGQVRIYDAADDRLVDTLDLSIPPGPTTRRTAPRAPYLARPYPYDGPRRTNADTKPGTPTRGVDPAPVNPPGDFQLTIIGGFTEGFHFYPVIVRGKTALITPHHNLLAYGRTYYVQVDPGVLAGDGFQGILGKDWRFTTKPRGPSRDAALVTVSARGDGDFSTVQGALDHVPDQPAQPGKRTTIFVKNGDYEEIVYFRNKRNLNIVGEDREKVRIHYANNEVFNPHPLNVATNELPGTFPSRRAAFTADNVQDIALVNLTIETTAKGQAEGLLLNGSRNIVTHVTVRGSGDALQTNGSAYYKDFSLTGDGDTILGRGPAFFEHCDIASKGAFMWIRNTEANHGNVFVGCRFTAIGGPTEIARLPDNKGRNYPYAEAVLLDATLDGISPAGWADVGDGATHAKFWEFNSRGADGKPVDVSARHPKSRQLDAARDAATIAHYRDPAWVLGGWQPALAPVIVAQPVAAASEPGAAGSRCSRCSCSSWRRWSSRCGGSHFDRARRRCAGTHLSLVSEWQADCTWCRCHGTGARAGGVHGRGVERQRTGGQCASRGRNLSLGRLGIRPLRSTAGPGAGPEAGGCGLRAAGCGLRARGCVLRAAAWTVLAEATCNGLGEFG